MKRIFALLLTLFFVGTAAAQNVTSLSDTSSAVGFHIQAVASSDHLTDKTDVSSLTCRRSKNGADAACAGTSAEVSDANHPGTWFYSLGSGDIDTQGTVLFTLSATGMDIFRKELVVGPLVKLSTGSILNTTYAARGTAQSVTGTTLVMASSETFANNELKDNTAVIIVSATTGTGQVTCVRGNVGASDTLTVDTWATTPTGTITYDLLPAPGCTIRPNDFAMDAITAAALASDAASEIGTVVWATATRQLTGTQTFNLTGTITGNLSGNVTGSTASVTGNVGGNLGGNVLGSVATVNALGLDSVNSTSLAASAVTEIAAGISFTGEELSTGTAQSVANSPVPKIRLAASETYGDNVLADNAMIVITGATTGKGQARCACANAASNDEVTLCLPWRILPTGTITYSVRPVANCNLAKYPRPN